MHEYLETGVKPLIEAHPEVGRILDRYGVGCVACTDGTCKLGEVVKLHGLSPGAETEMMAQIERAIQATGDAVPVAPPEPVEADLPHRREIAYSPPVRRLVDEHRWILRLVALLPDVVGEVRASGQIDADLMRAAVDFIRGYADRYHHMKEEDILFDYTDREADIVRVILEDHERARGYVRGVVQAVEEGDADALCANLGRYRALLTEHITKEDEILYPYIDRGLTTSQVGELYSRFAEAESRLPDDVPQRYERFIARLEARFQKVEAIP